ncbi:hypothetical protein LSCM1_06405 [Leishmania martiniquensis]|uniref:Uncharacterized protein n=1 Tax=Leishmania martiniquensis TaxID=1580590 RepID=A0A836GRH5_9TRYP|nr:hypothetical protein LSCM1_06405 [Leishmania martiniquensis]
MLAAVLHVLLFVAGLVGLLGIKQRRLRHIPTRRTHISRRNAEGALWLQRFVNALLDMLHSAVAEQQVREAAEAAAARGGTSVGTSLARQAADAPVAKDAPEQSAASAGGSGIACDKDSDSAKSAEVLSELPVLNALKAQLEDQISALLEDKGIASFADLRIKDWGGKPPVIKAVYLSHGGGSSGSTAGGATGAAAPSSAAALTSLSGSVGGLASMEGMGAGGAATVAQQRTTAGMPVGSPSGLGPQLQMLSPVSGGSLSYSNVIRPLAASTISAERNGDPSVDTLNTLGRPKGDPSVLPGLRYLSSGEEAGSAAGRGTLGRERSFVGSVAHTAHLAGNSGSHSGAETGVPAAGPSSAANAAGVTASQAAGARHAKDTTRSLSVLDAEIEVEYSGNFSVSLNADLPIARGRYLQVYVSLSDVRMLAAHVRLRLSLEYEPATVESPQPQPYLRGTLWLLSDPMFDAAFHSTLTQYRIRDCFMVTKLVKFFLLRFIRTKLRPCSQAATPSRPPWSHCRRGGGGVSGNVVAAACGAALGTGGKESAGSSTGVSEGLSEDAQRGATDASGLSFRVQLPASVVDGGEQWWSSSMRDSMSERPVPFTSAHYVL